jgi:hypothetical protein
MPIPLYPNFTPINLDLREQFHGMVLKSKTSMSAFAFASLYLFRSKYNFEVSILEDSLLTAGTYKEKTFFAVLGNLPRREFLVELLKKYDYWKGISEEQATELKTLFPNETITEDCDNFEYLYSRTDLAELPGKKKKKKKNLVNAFLKACDPEERKFLPLDKNTAKDALHVLDAWKQSKNIQGDYEPAKEALELHEVLGLSGMVFYLKNTPIGYCQGETLVDGKSFAVHFEKANDEHKGVYQYINQEFAKNLPPCISYINREQDLGDEGLRQAKMTYRPVGFVKLFSSKVSIKAE